MISLSLLIGCILQAFKLAVIKTLLKRPWLDPAVLVIYNDQLAVKQQTWSHVWPGHVLQCARTPRLETGEDRGFQFEKTRLWNSLLLRLHLANSIKKQCLLLLFLFYSNQALFWDFCWQQLFLHYSVPKLVLLYRVCHYLPVKSSLKFKLTHLLYRVQRQMGDVLATTINYIFIYII